MHDVAWSGRAGVLRSAHKRGTAMEVVCIVAWHGIHSPTSALVTCRYREPNQRPCCWPFRQGQANQRRCFFAAGYDREEDTPAGGAKEAAAHGSHMRQPAPGASGAAAPGSSRPAPGRRPAGTVAALKSGRATAALGPRAGSAERERCAACVGYGRNVRLHACSSPAGLNAQELRKWGRNVLLLNASSGPTCCKRCAS